MRQSLRDDAQEDEQDDLKPKKRPRAKARGHVRVKEATITHGTETEDPETKSMLDALDHEDQMVRNESDLPGKAVPAHRKGKGRGRGRGRSKRATPTEPTVADSYLHFC